MRGLEKISAFEWRLNPRGKMRVPGVIYADAHLIEAMDDKVFEQLENVACLPGIVKAALAMPDAHWGYGFPIGGVGAFDPDAGGVISAGGVGFDIACGVRTLLTDLDVEDILPVQEKLADLLAARIPAGLGITGSVRLTGKNMDDMLAGGAAWAVNQGFGRKDDLERIEENGRMPGADLDMISEEAKKRQKDETGTLGSGNHYLEVQKTAEIFSPRIADVFGLSPGQALVTIHCGSRGLGHQIGTDYLKKMAVAAQKHGIDLPDRELACAPVKSDLGRAYLGAMRGGINCALANRQVLTHLTRLAFEEMFPGVNMPLLFDVAHNTCKEEIHLVDGKKKRLFVHRKGATRSFGPGNPVLPEPLKSVGQPVLIGGSMGTSSYILAGTGQNEEKSFGSACHGAGRSLSRRQAAKRYKGRDVLMSLAHAGVIVRSHSLKGVAEEAPGAYKDVGAVVDAAHNAGLALKVARVEPVICVKG